MDDRFDLMTEVVRYTREPDGRPTVVTVPFTQVGPDEPGAIELDHVGPGTWWIPSGGDVPEDQRMTADEFRAALDDWDEAESARREAAVAEAERLADDRRARAAKARQELFDLGLSNSTIDLIVGGKLS